MWYYEGENKIFLCFCYCKEIKKKKREEKAQKTANRKLPHNRTKIILYSDSGKSIFILK